MSIIKIGDKVSLREGAACRYNWSGFATAEVTGVYGCKAIIKFPDGDESFAYIFDLNLCD